ncbi:hypothetical protein GH714_014652 [Hevea brasiliensis]|uniref:nicotinate phosphoribosyltransferase n=1 Tax=Hevea brasiliensis TaxID=3981 RepID=A0A6A6K5P7_HEVBR|nr:hypothetical protein GH714_014652 [Hevea brasiliensis]
MEVKANGPNGDSGRMPDGTTNPMVTPLLTDLYQFTMAYAYWKVGKHQERAAFDLYFRKNPFGGEYTIFAGLEECIRFIANFNFTEDEISFIHESLPGSCEDGFCVYLRGLDCSEVELYAMPEGSVVFPKVPLLRIEGPFAGPDGGIGASKYCYIGGFDATSVQIHYVALLVRPIKASLQLSPHMPWHFPNNFLALVDTYDVMRSGIPNFCAVALALSDLG